MNFVSAVGKAISDSGNIPSGETGQGPNFNRTHLLRLFTQARGMNAFMHACIQAFFLKRVRYLLGLVHGVGGGVCDQRHEWFARTRLAARTLHNLVSCDMSERTMRQCFLRDS